MHSTVCLNIFYNKRLFRKLIVLLTYKGGKETLMFGNVGSGAVRVS